MTTLSTPRDAVALLQELGAPAHLLRHHLLVLEAAELLVRELGRAFSLRVDVAGHLAARALQPTRAAA